MSGQSSLHRHFSEEVRDRHRGVEAAPSRSAGVMGPIQRQTYRELGSESRKVGSRGRGELRRGPADPLVLVLVFEQSVDPRAFALRRSQQVVHKGDHTGRSWGWDIAEHLVMAGHVFPLVVKLMLEQDGHYRPTDSDSCACMAVGPLLVETQWVASRDPEDTGHSWQEVISKTTNNVRFKRTMANIEKENPEWFRGEDEEPTPG
jgi:hypothetical protein